MQIANWGNSLAVRIPAAMIEALGLKEGDEIEIERYHFSIYDAMIATAARAAGCDILWSEDMQDGMKRGEGLRIFSPFRSNGS